MNFLGIEFEVKNRPVLDENFIPLAKFNTAFLKTAKVLLSIAVHRNNNLVSVFNTYIHGTPEMYAADRFFVERTIKFLLWAKGGYKVTICGDKKIADYIAEVYSKKGKRAFDNIFMERVYEKPFEICYLPIEQRIIENEVSKPIGRHLDGCRIGFDAGGSDRKVSAVIDGEVIFSEEVVWHPKTNKDPDYHYNGIVEAFKRAAKQMPRVDAIGISSAGIYIDNRTMIGSLFLKVPDSLFDLKVKDIYIRAAKEIGDVPVEVANDGDVTALAGAMDLEDINVLGIAMGTSEAGGYVNMHGNITGWLNELAFTPVDGQQDAAIDEWSGDKGCGVNYFSQDAVIRLAPKAGITLSENLSPAQKLQEVQKLIKQNQTYAREIFETIGVYMGHTLPYYAFVYNIKNVLLLGRVMSGEGGNIILKNAKKVLKEEYPEVYASFSLHLPDEKSRRIGQSVAAASLPDLTR